MKAIVLIADIVSSKKIKDRGRIQQKLKTELKKINRDSDSILSPMTITLGDEFQCVYSDADAIYKNIWEILYICYPERIRFSLGVGEITTSINRKQAIGMDGPAFYEAREGLTHLKQKDYLFDLRSSEANPQIVDLARSILHLVSHNIESWKKNRLEIMSLLSGGFSVKIISDKLKISEQAVYKNITNGGLQPILDITKNLSVIINNMVKD